MGVTSKSPAQKAGPKKWQTMTGVEKGWFVARVCIMVCSFGFIYGGVLVEGMDFEM